MLLHYLGKLKIQIFGRYGRKRKQTALCNRLELCYSSTNFDIFDVKNSESFFFADKKGVLGRFINQSAERPRLRTP